VAKYNQLLRIEEALGDDASYPGREAFQAALESASPAPPAEAPPAPEASPAPQTPGAQQTGGLFPSGGAPSAQ
jgi:hypothetical protein